MRQEAKARKMEKKQVQDADGDDDKSMEGGSEDEGDFFKEKGGEG